MKDALAALDRRFLAIERALDPEPGEHPAAALFGGIAALANHLAASELVAAGLPVDEEWVDRITDAIQDAVERTIGELRGRN